MTLCRALPFLAISILFFPHSLLFGQTNFLTFSSAAAPAGGAVTLNLNLTVADAAVPPAALEWTLSYPAGDVASISVSAGAALTDAGKTLLCSSASGSLICLSFGMNANTIASGTIAEVAVTLAPATAGPSTTISALRAVEAFADGTGASMLPASGIVLVQNSPQQPSNPAPSVAFLSPSSAIAGGGAFTLTVNGNGFLNGSVVYWKNAARPTTFVSAAQLQVAISAADLVMAGTAPVMVFNPAPGGGTSSMLFTIAQADAVGPVITSLSPASATAGTAAFLLTVDGSGFVSGSVVNWNGSPRVTMYAGGTQLLASISAADIASVAMARVTVLTPGNVGSSTWEFAVTGRPVLTVRSTHNGNFIPGQAGATYSIIVSNQGSGSTFDTVTVTDALPVGLVATAIGGSGWTCAQPSGPCARSDVLVPGGSYPFLTLTVNVSPTALSSITNQVIVSGGGSSDRASGSDSTAVTTSASSPPAAVSSTPPAGSGAFNTFAFTFSDPRGRQDLGVVNILVNSSLDGRRACFLAYSRALNVLYLVADDGGVLLPGSLLTSAGSTGNSQCTVSWGPSPVSGNDNTLVLSLNVVFSSAFAGNKVIYMAAGDVAGNNSGWQPLGVWQVPAVVMSTTTAVMGMTPSRGSGTGQGVFTFNFFDALGYQDLGVENILINSYLDGRHACYLAYARPSNVLFLVSDAGDTLIPGQSLSVSGTMGNSQCTVSWGSGAVTAANNDLALSLNISFSPAFAGSHVFYVAARDRNEVNNTGWQSVGTWSVQ